MPDCEINSGPCVRETEEGHIKVVLDIRPKPVRTMSKLALSVDISSAERPIEDAQVTIAFTMPGMVMAENRYMLSGKGKGRYEGEGVIVRCPSGKRIWQADVSVTMPREKTGETVLARYIFEVDK